MVSLFRITGERVGTTSKDDGECEAAGFSGGGVAHLKPACPSIPKGVAMSSRILDHPDDCSATVVWSRLRARQLRRCWALAGMRDGNRAAWFVVSLLNPCWVPGYWCAV